MSGARSALGERRAAIAKFTPVELYRSCCRIKCCSAVAFLPMGNSSLFVCACGIPIVTFIAGAVMWVFTECRGHKYEEGKGGQGAGGLQNWCILACRNVGEVVSCQGRFFMLWSVCFPLSRISGDKCEGGLCPRAYRPSPQGRLAFRG